MNDAQVASSMIQLFEAGEKSAGLKRRTKTDIAFVQA